MLEHIDHWREAPLWTPEAIATATREWFMYLSAGETSASDLLKAESQL